jgi:radical SAM superfamily enzyme YgiQ (UPF0313 family)
MTKLITYLNYNPVDDGSLIPYFWLSMKAYVQDNYPESLWQYTKPLGYQDKVLEEIEKNAPNVVLASLYVWNYDETMKILSEIKNIVPGVLIIVGGPHQLYKSEPGWFKTHNQIDLVCKEDGYGEVFFSELLKTLDKGTSITEIPFCVYPTEDRLEYRISSTTFNKLDFKWPVNIFKRFKEEVLGKTVLFLECSRGCPYKCVFCEWGGGTGSKVSFKPTTSILEDLEYLFKECDIEYIINTDANFGIIKRDLEIVQYIVKNSNATLDILGPSKTNPKILYQIFELLLAQENHSEYKMSIQDLDPEVNRNIKRKDLSVDEHLALFKGISSEARLELILGLPGATLDKLFDVHDFIVKHGLASYDRYLWVLLPTAPAYEKEYREEFKLGYENFNTIEEGFQFSPIEGTIDFKSNPSPIVTSSYSYTREDWITMYRCDILFMSWTFNGFMSKLFRNKDIRASVLAKDIYFDFLPNHLEGLQGELAKELLKHEGPNIEVVDLSNTELKINIHMRSLATLIVMLNPTYFFAQLGVWAQKYKSVEILEICASMPNLIEEPTGLGGNMTDPYSNLLK